MAIARRSEGRIRAPRNVIADLLRDEDVEVRRLAAEWIGDLHRTDVGPTALLGALDAGPARVQAALGWSLYRAGKRLDQRTRFLAAMLLKEILQKNNDTDPVLRHACVMGLAGVASPEQIVTLGTEGSVAVRRAAIVALRRLGSPLVTRLIDHGDRLVYEEGARAIYDRPILEAFPKLASMVLRDPASEPLTRRALAANYRLGDAAAARRVAGLIDHPSTPNALRKEAWWMLEHWAEPSGIDRVLGMWRPIERRSSEPAAAALRAKWKKWRGDRTKGARAALAATRLGLAFGIPYLEQVALEANQPAWLRAEALKAIDQRDPQRGLSLARRLLSAKAAVLRGAAQAVMVRRAPREAVPQLIKQARKGKVAARRRAFTLLGTIGHPDAEAVLVECLDQMLQGKLDRRLQLEVLQAARKYVDTFGSQQLARRLAARDAAGADKPPVERHSELLAGGDAARGERAFFEDLRASCSRCHTIDGRGGQVGPDLSHVAKEKDRKAILEAIIDPNRTIAKGFETVAVFTEDGRVVTGIVRTEDDQRLVLVDAAGRPVEIPQASIEERQTMTSAMPQDMLQQLPPDVIRDLVEFLAGRR